MKPRWSTSQSLKRDSYPQNDKDLQLNWRTSSIARTKPKLREVGRPRFQGRKTQAVLASPGRASTVAVLPHCSITQTSVQLLRTSPRALSATLPKVTRKRAGAQPTRSGCLGPQAQIWCQKTGPSRGPKNGAAKWTQLPQHHLELNWGGETATPKLEPFGDPVLGSRILLFFGLNPALSRLLHSGDSGPQTSMEGSITENHDLRRHILLVETINMKETCTGEAPTREARIA